MSFFKKDRCKICKERRGHRFCLRLANNICWYDCNKLRIDLKCPEECSYSLQQQDNFQLKTKADSQMEYTDLLKKQIDKWISSSQKVFNDQIPLQIIETENGKKKIISFLNQFKAHPLVPLSYLKERLSLDDLEVDSHVKSYEDISMEFLTTIVLHEWENSANFLQNSTLYANKEYLTNYIQRLSSNMILAKMTEFDLISSASTKQNDQVLVHFEVNRKYDLTLNLIKIDTNWKVVSKIFSKPEIFNNEKEAIQQVAVLLSKNQLSNAYELLKKYSEIYVDSADFHYYWGLYYSFSKNNKKAEKHLFNAVEIDPDFTEAKGLYATILLQNNQSERAKTIYLEIIKKNPKELKSMNNLASIYIEEGDKDKARELLERCLKINPNFMYARKNLEKINTEQIL
ncbi:MAG: tetratricopeptide repeat protein [Candidatus Cloacimonetes bacterium]|nr:tetratricopeptide repeat protein [Candidatus Cloacimonadota bacterium]MBL7149986.1 tetratricopeptide repeat protein [Candidatus Cloacimonadota bacterium]